jgi:hypothetical protein
MARKKSQKADTIVTRLPRGQTAISSDEIPEIDTTKALLAEGFVIEGQAGTNVLSPERI